MNKQIAALRELMSEGNSLSGLGEVDLVGDRSVFQSSLYPDRLFARIEVLEIDPNDGGAIPIYHYHEVDQKGAVIHDADTLIRGLSDKDKFYRSLTPYQLPKP